MESVINFFKKLFKHDDWPPQWQNGNWTLIHGWIYILSNVLIGLGLMFISITAIKFVYRDKEQVQSPGNYYLFATLAIATGIAHLLDAIAFYTPLYHLSALVLCFTAIISWCIIYRLIRDTSLQLPKKSSRELKGWGAPGANTDNIKQELLRQVKATSAELAAYKFALDESSIFAVTDQKGTITYVNENFCRISKYTREELLGKDHRIINSGYHSAAYIKNLWVTIANGKIWRGQLRNRAKDSSIYWVDTTIVPFLNNEGKPYQYVAIRSDITEKKKIEEKQAFYELVINSSADAIFTQNLENIITSWNKGAGNIFGFGEQEILGQSADIITPVHLRQEMLHLKAQVIAGKGETSCETQRIHKDGHLVDLQISISQLKDLDGNVIGITLIGKDITAVKKAYEEKKKNALIYQTIASNIPGCTICLLDREFRYIFVEGDLAEKMGYNKSALLNSFIEDVISGGDLVFMKDCLSRVFHGQVFDIQTSNEKYAALTRFVPLKDDNGNVFNALTLSIDITAIKNAHQQIEQLNQSLERKVEERTEQLNAANKELESFSYSISHDLRAPLRAINGYTKILEEDYSNCFDDEGARILTAVKDNAKKMGILIDDLLNFSRISRKDLNLVQINMRAKVDQCLMELLPKEEAHRYAIHISELHSACGDDALMKQVWLNLLSNAVKYTAKKKNPLITVASKLENDTVVYTIQDNGAGFDMQYAAKLFGVFQRLHAAQEFEGTGVGLALVKRIINKHGGDVWADAREHEGATFYFSLPAAQVLAADT